MSRYRWDGSERDAYDEGHRASSWASNPHDRYGDHEERQRHDAYSEGYEDRRREREREEERRQEEAAEEARARRAAEERAWEDEAEVRQYEEQPGPEIEPGDAA